MKSKVNIDNIVAFFLCLMPVLDPYVLLNIAGFEIRLILAILSVFAVYYIVKMRSISHCRPITLLLAGLLLLNVAAAFTPLSSLDAFFLSTRVGLSWLLASIVFVCNVKLTGFDLVEQWSIRIAVAACALLFFQFICLICGWEGVWNGRLPFLPLSEYDGWSRMIDITGAIRAHSFFQEPSYLGVYLAPVTAMVLHRKKYWLAAVFALAVLLSTSTLAIATLCVIVVFHLFYSAHITLNRSNILRFLAVLGGLLAVVLIVYWLVEPFRHMVNYSVTKIFRIFSDLQDPRMGSTRLRLIGNVHLLAHYPWYNWIFGVGINQYTVIFEELIQFEYSNSVVNMLLNSGIVGAVLFVGMGVFWVRKTKQEYRIYPVLFLIVMFTDQMLFGWYFFYLVLWVLYALDKSGYAAGTQTLLLRRSRTEESPK